MFIRWNIPYSNIFAVTSFASALLDYHVSQTLSTAFFNFFQILFSKDLKRRKRDLNPRAAINDLLPFQGAPSASWVFLHSLNNNFFS